MKINTLRFGEIEYTESQVISFMRGILGFPQEQKFVLLQDSQSPFMWLQSLQTPELAFVVMDPWLVLEEYVVELSEELKKRLKIDNEAQVMTVGITVIPEDPKKMTINLRAPLIINFEEKIGEQIVLSNENYDIRYPVFSA